MNKYTVNKEEYPNDAEEVSYSDYNIFEKTPSKFLSDITFQKSIGFSCPRCDILHNELEHSHLTSCNCGLKMQRYGNALYIWGTPIKSV